VHHLKWWPGTQAPWHSWLVKHPPRLQWQWWVPLGRLLLVCHVMSVTFTPPGGLWKGHLLVMATTPYTCILQDVQVTTHQ
jgi:hypothetical protein